MTRFPLVRLWRLYLSGKKSAFACKGKPVGLNFM
jgi:hypothetical protein